MSYKTNSQQDISGAAPIQEISDVIQNLVRPDEVISVLNNVVSNVKELQGLRVSACTIAQRIDDQYALQSASAGLTQVPSSTRESSEVNMGGLDPQKLTPKEESPIVPPLKELPPIEFPPVDVSPSPTGSTLIDAFNEALLANNFSGFSVADFKLSQVPTIQAELLVLGCRVTITRYNIYIDCE